VAEDVGFATGHAGPAGKPHGHLGGLDGLRGIACLAVLATHATVHFAPEATPGPLPEMMAQGLTVFFAMSGLLIALPFVRDIATGERRVRVSRYAVRRLRRVFPAYLVIFTIANFVFQAGYLVNAAVVHDAQSDAGTGMITDVVPLVLNLSLLQSFSTAWLETGIPPSWSLTTELTFYAILPLIMVPMVSLGRRLRRPLLAALLPAILLWITGLIGRVWSEQLFARMDGVDSFEAEFGPYPVAVLSRSLLGLGDMFAVGMVVCVLFVWTERGQLRGWTRDRARLVAVAAIVVGAAGAVVLHESHPWFLGAFTTLVAGGLILLIADAEARRERSAFIDLVGWRPFEYVGKISLSVYLWHFPLLILMTRAGLFTRDSAPTAIGATASLAAVSIVLASVTYFWVERPGLTGQWPAVRRRRASNTGVF
jgi:peptidoglycan/LPS O-acetylase OafA/YrhL